MATDLTKCNPALARRILAQMQAEDAGKLRPLVVEHGNGFRQPVQPDPRTFDPTVPSIPLTGLKITIRGQIRGGKNNMGVSRDGHHYPNKKWAAWRNEAVAQVKRQLPTTFRTITTPINMRLDYVAGDRCRRDMPAIIDSIFHVLEKSGIVSDDTLIWFTVSSRSYDPEKPRAELTFL